MYVCDTTLRIHSYRIPEDRYIVYPHDAIPHIPTVYKPIPCHRSPPNEQLPHLDYLRPPIMCFSPHPNYLSPHANTRAPIRLAVPPSARLSHPACGTPQLTWFSPPSGENG